MWTARSRRTLEQDNLFDAFEELRQVGIVALSGKAAGENILNPVSHPQSPFPLHQDMQTVDKR